MSDQERSDTDADGVFTQRVFASGFTVGDTGNYYDYWGDDWRRDRNKKEGFWFPRSPLARFSLQRGLDSNQGHWLAKFTTVATAPLLYLFNLFAHIPVNAEPDKDWKVLINAPALPKTFKPQAIRYGQASSVSDGSDHSDFNEGYDPPADARDANKGSDGSALDPADPYDSYKGKGLGNEQTEASQRYEDHATLRMLARREDKPGWVDSQGKVVGEDDLTQASADYQKWRTERINQILDAGVDNNATNHSTIMTNAEHAEKALAYDVAIGLCDISEDDFIRLRWAADWRFADGLPANDPSRPFAEYFQSGSMKRHSLTKWLGADSDASMPSKIVDERDGGFLMTAGSAL
jgi:hypothetical protein